MRACISALWLASLCAFTDAAVAQTAPSNPGAVGQQQLRSAAERTANFAAQGFVPSQDIPPQEAGASIPPALLRQFFSISSITVTGATVFTSADFAPLFADYVNRPNTLAEIYALAAAVEAKYRSAGYPFTTARVPGQRLKDGRLEIRVTEFRVSEVNFTLDGQPIATPEALRPAVAAILAEQPVRLRTLQSASAAASRMSGYRVATTRIQRLANGRLRLIVMLVRPGENVVAIQPEYTNMEVIQAAHTLIPLREIRVTGSTVFKTVDFAPMYASLLGHTVTLAQLLDLAQRIQDKYVAAGYFGTTVSVPPQVVQQGVVTLEVTELKVEHVRVNLNGRPLPQDDLLSRAANAITAEQPVTTATIQRQLDVLSHIPGVLVQSIIPPVTDDPNAQLYLTRKPLTFTTAIDNRGTSVTGPTQLGMMLQESGLLGLNEEIRLLGLKTIGTGDLSYYGTQFFVPLGSSGLILSGMLSHVAAYPGDFLAPSEITALGDMVGFSLSYPIIANARMSSSLILTFDLFNNSSSILNGKITTSDERSRAFRIESLTTLLDGTGAQNTLELQFSQGINGLGARPNGEQINVRPGLNLSGNKVVVDLRRDQPLPQGLKLAVRFRGQLAFSALPSAELMNFGGVEFGRAYDPSILSGDSGIAGIATLSRPIQLGNRFVPVLEPFVYYDNGETFSRLTTPGVPSSASAASTGIGLRFFTSFGIGGWTELDFPLTHGATLAPGEEDNKQPRIFFFLFAQL